MILTLSLGIVRPLVFRMAKEFYQTLVPFAFFCFSEEAVLVKSLKYLSDVFPVLNWIIRADQNVIKINDNTLIK